MITVIVRLFGPHRLPGVMSFFSVGRCDYRRRPVCPCRVVPSRSTFGYSPFKLKFFKRFHDYHLNWLSNGRRAATNLHQLMRLNYVVCSAAAEGFPLPDHGEWVSAETLLSLDTVDRLDCDGTKQAHLFIVKTQQLKHIKNILYCL